MRQLQVGRIQVDIRCVRLEADSSWDALNNLTDLIAQLLVTNAVSVKGRRGKCIGGVSTYPHSRP